MHDMLNKYLSIKKCCFLKMNNQITNKILIPVRTTCESEMKYIFVYVKLFPLELWQAPLKWLVMHDLLEVWQFHKHSQKGAASC
jgi:hypothetical protein